MMCMLQLGLSYQTAGLAATDDSIDQSIRVEIADTLTPKIEGTICVDHDMPKTDALGIRDRGYQRRDS